MRRLLLWVAVVMVVTACGEAAEPAPTSPAGGSADASGGQDVGAADSAGLDDGAGGDAAPGDVAPGTDAASADASPDTAADTAADVESDAALDTAADAAPDTAADTAADVESDAAPADAGAETDAAGTLDSVNPADAPAPEDSADPQDSAPSIDTADAAPGPDVAVCVPTAPSSEVCDGVDNDCDGKTDDSDPCEDGNPCTVGSCGLAAGKVQCLQKPSPGGESCDDGNPCSVTAECAKGICQGDANCTDGVACTLDSCDPAKGCVFVANDAKCADGNSCTSDACDPAKGCSNPPTVGSCDDGDACSSGSVCDGGACVGNQPVVCDDKNPCTSDVCDKVKGCVYTATTAPCDDGNACTTGEVCAASKCQGGKAKCDDGDLCTTDSCDSAGTCSNTAIAGCKACSAASQCSDNDACTTDNCTAGKCAWAPIAGCVGPTNYSVTSFSSNKPTLTGGSVATFSVTVANLGKPWPGGAIAKLKWEVWFSVDDQLDAGDALAATKTWSSYNIGAPNQTSASESVAWTYARPVNWYHKFQCVKLVYSADATDADNVKCLPVVVEDGEVSLKSVIAAGSKLKSSYDPYGQPVSTIVLDTANPGTKAYQPSTTVYLSQDDKWDATDKPLSTTLKPTVAMGDATTTLTFGTLQFQSAVTGKVWVCVRSDVDIAQYELTPGDNTVCGQVEVENPAEFVHGDPTYTNGYLTFDQTSGPGTAAYGVAAACKKLGVYNIGMGKVTGGFAARCFLSTTGAVADASWVVQWKHPGDLASGTLNCSGGYTCGAKVDLLSPLGAKIETPAVGANKLCVEVNYDKGVLESDYTNNTLCVPVTVVGPNLQVNTKLTAENGGVAVGLKVGVSWSGMFAVNNIGNGDLTGLDGKLLARIWLSKDNKLSGDDVKLWEGVQTGFNTFTKQMGQFPNNYALPTATTKPSIIVPAGTAAGSYFLIYQINADNLFAEPLGDNLFAKPATVSL